jgi:hypothetical protein
MEQGIAAIQAGNLSEGARLLRIALKSDVLTGSLRATACMWLAETSPDAEFKRTCYQEALTADPNNPDAKQRLATLLAAQLPPTPAPQAQPGGYTPPAPTPAYTPPAAVPGTGSLVTPLTVPGTGPLAPAQPAAPGMTQPMPSYRIAGIIGGPNGPGTAFFVMREGLLATTRYVVGGIEHLTVELENRRQILGRVVRTFAEYDLALIHVEQQVSDLMPMSSLPQVPDNAFLRAVSYNGQAAPGKKRATKRILAAHWFPTDIRKVPDAGGDPVFDENHYLLGMLTKDVDRASGCVYGLHIAAIYRLVEQFRQEMYANRNAAYCPSCGGLSRAAAAGGYYCEICGSIMAQSQNITRLPQPQLVGFYYENERITCTRCGANVGFHQGKCLRCGQAPTARM